jgi:MinD superfamily P-loop ATPase
VIERHHLNEKHQFERLMKREEVKVLLQIPEFFDVVDSLLEDDGLLNWNELFPFLITEVKHLIVEMKGAHCGG